MEATLEHLSTMRTLPIAMLDAPEKALPLCYALMAGGIDILAVSIRSNDCAAILQTITTEMPEMFVGVADTISRDQVSEAQLAGARFVVTDGFDPLVVDFAREEGLPILPGVMTPSNMTRALARGYNIVNFFPAEVAGIDLMTAEVKAFRQLNPRIVATGGIDNTNMKKWLTHPAVLAVGMSWICPDELIAEENWPEITRRAHEAQAIAHS